MGNTLKQVMLCSFVFIAMLLMVFSIFLPWYNIEYEKDGHTKGTDFYIDSYIYYNETSDEKINEEYETKGPAEDIYNAGYNTRVIAIIGAILLLISYLMLLLMVLEKVKPKFAYPPLLAGIFWTFFTAVYGIISIGGAVLDGYGFKGSLFFGSKDIYSWSPSIAFYVVILAAVLIIVQLLVVIFNLRKQFENDQTS